MIDLRSDTVTKPSKEMRNVMANAEVGDDVYKEDPTVNRLQDYCAELFGKEAALFVSSGVMGNQLCLNVLTQPGDEIICDKDSHIFHYESGSPAMLSGLSINLLQGENGVFTTKQVEDAIHPTSSYYMSRSRVIEVENTHNVAGGVIHPIENIKALKEVADKNNLKMHLDGARLWNASVATGISLAEYSSYFDTVSVCLSKGLGAPVGSVIIGKKDLIDEAFRKRKAWGGGMRQIGIIAAGGLYAIENNFKLEAYISLITNTLLGVAIFFELPVVIFFLTKIGLITPQFLRKYRKHALVLVLVLSAIITPPDVASQIIVSIPILILYEIGIYISGFVQKKQLKNAK